MVRSTIDRLAMTEITSVLLALLCMLGQVTGMPRNTCGVDARPHANGICGSMLMRARTNLCFLLTADYPNYFHGRKRSVNDLFDYPIQSFAKMNLFGDDGDVTETPVDQNDMYGKLHLTRLTQAPSPAAKPASVKRADNMLHLQKRGMVCDCCYNRCLASELARYC